jgi:hypothetical protein
MVEGGTVISAERGGGAFSVGAEAKTLQALVKDTRALAHGAEWTSTKFVCIFLFPNPHSA